MSQKEKKITNLTPSLTVHCTYLHQISSDLARATKNELPKNVFISYLKETNLCQISASLAYFESDLLKGKRVVQSYQFSCYNSVLE